MSGWIKLHRQIRRHALFKQKRKFSRFEAWIDILLEVNHRGEKVPIGNEWIECNRGQTITSIRKLSERWGWSKTKTTAYLKFLKDDQMIDFFSDTKKTVLTVLNWDVYQDTEDTERTEKGHQTDGRRTQNGTNNNIKNEKNVKNNNMSQTPHQKIVDLFNTTCKTLPKVKIITDGRKDAMRLRWGKYGDLETFKRLFTMAEKSDFLSGRNGIWNNCSFDWLIKEANMVKVLENHYSNERQKGGYRGGQARNFNPKPGYRPSEQDWDAEPEGRI